MNTVRKLVIGVGAIGAMTSVARAQPPASDTATAQGSATIIQPIQASSTQNLAFGTIVKPTGATPGTVTIDNSGGRTQSGATLGLLGTPTAANFQVVGEGQSAYTVSVSPSFNLVSGTNTLIVTTTNSSGGGGTLGGTLGGTAGTATFGVGGSFSLNSATASGNYTGNIQVIASYQ